MQDEQLKYKMYGLVPYNLSPIQQAIQYNHAVVEYMINNQPYDIGSDLYNWGTYNKTFTILNGGDTNNELAGYPEEHIGSLNQHKEWLIKEKIKIASYNEPDLGFQLTAVVFLADERVYDLDKYPNFEKWVMDKGVFIKTDTHEGEPNNYLHNLYNEYINNIIGGMKNYKLRKWLTQFKPI